MNAMMIDSDLQATTSFPAEASMIMSALEAGHAADAGHDHRRGRRSQYRSVSAVRLFVDSLDAQPRPIYTRDIDRRGLGFITQSRMPLGYGGMVSVPLADGQCVTVHCSVLRCREVSTGWFEGSLLFNREQTAFDELLPDSMSEPSNTAPEMTANGLWQDEDEA